MNDRDCENCKHHTEKGCDSWDCKFEQGMKRKEIIEMLKVLKEQALKSHNDTAIIDVKKDSFIYVMDATINSLKMEQIEPCDDAISRQAVQDYIAKYLSQYLYNDVREAVEVIDEYIGELPSVNPQKPKTGHWIVSEWKDEIYTNVATCSLCDAEVINNGADKFCPNCGCRMIKPQERSDKV